MNLLYSNDKRGAYPPSWYAATTPALPPFAELRGEAKADVCVVGGGFTGLSAALHLAGRGYDVVLVDAQRVGFGASGRNGGQVGGGFNLDQPELERAMGEADARLLWQIGRDAVETTRDLAAKHAPDSAWRDGIALAAWSAKEAEKYQDYQAYLAQSYGYDQAEPLDRAALAALVRSPVYHGGVVDWGSGHLHPLRFALGLAKAAAAAGVRIHEGTHVHHIREGAKPLVQTDKGRVLADQLILACNGYLGGLNRKVAARVMPINNYMVATEPLGDRAAGVLSRDIAVADSKFVVNYFRLSEDKRLLFGGGESYGHRFPRDIAAKVRGPMETVFPQLKGVKIDHAWGGTLAITATRMPYFGQVGPNIWNASGYSGHGVALATLAGRILSDAIAGQSERFDLLSRVPLPRFPGGRALSRPVLTLAMSWYSMRDRLGI